VFADTDTGLPEWILVDVEDRRAFVPVGDAEQEDERVRVRFSRDQVRSAPDVGDVAELTEDDEKQLYTHYGVAFSTKDSDSVLPVGATESADAVPAAAAERPTTPQPVAPAAWAPQAGPASSGGSAAAGSSGAALAAVAGLVAAVWLGLRERDRRAAARRSVSVRPGGLRRQLAAGSAAVAELTQHAAELTSAATARAAASTSDATRAGRSASRSAARSAARTSAASARRAARQRKKLARTAARTGSAVTVTARQLGQAVTRAASGAGEAVTDSSRQLASAASAAGSALTGSSRQLAETAAAVPVRAARRGRKVRRSVGRVIWDAVLAAAAGAGYVAGARAGRERYDVIAALAAETAERPEVRRVADTVTATVTDPERRAKATGALREMVRPQHR